MQQYSTIIVKSSLETKQYKCVLKAHSTRLQNILSSTVTTVLMQSATKSYMYMFDFRIQF